MKKLILFLTVFVLGFGQSFAQNKDIEFDKKNFKDQKSEFKDALKALEEGDALLEPAPIPRYVQAIPFYEQAYEFNPNSSYLNYKLGICYLNSIYKFKCLDYFKKSHQLNPDKFDDIHFYLGRGYHLRMEWDSAIKEYNTFKKRLDPVEHALLINETTKHIRECESGKELVKTPERVWIDNLGKSVNTEAPEYGMIMTADASEIFFTSRRPNTTGEGKDPFLDEYFEDLYSSKLLENGKWETAKNIGSPINTKGHDAAVALSPDGSRMVVYIDDNGDGNLYESVRKGDEWSKPKMFNKEISGPYQEPSAWYSSDGKLLYFVSDRPLEKRGEAKDKDIYIASWNEEKEEWLNIQRLPNNINSSYNEDGIFLHPDGRTLYFSSEGHNSMGGYDIFKTVKQDDGTWSDPINIGYPVNTPDDDVFFVVSASGRHGYMTSFRDGGYGDKDLYKITFLGAEKQPLLGSEDILLASVDAPITAKAIEPKVEVSVSLAILKGIVRDDKTKEPLEASIELIDNETGEIIAEFSSDAKNGKYLVSLPGGKNYGIAVKAEGYLFHSENFDVTEDAEYKEVEKIIDLKKLEVGEKIVLRNIFFDLNKYSLRDESQNELNRLIKLLNDNPKIRIEISGHTDSRGSAAYNKELSKNRAGEVVNYLIDKGIDKNRLEFAGYGEEQLIVSDAEIAKLKSKRAIEDAHQENRRTEFKILSN